MTITRTALIAIILTAALLGSCSSEPMDASSTMPSEAGAQAADTTLAPEPSDSPTTIADVSTTVTEATTTTTAPPLTYASIHGINTIGEFAGYTASGMGRWEDSVPGIADIRIPATADGTEQAALWLPPAGEGDKPLLVILHSWSAGYLQHAGIPYAMWALENGWAVIAPEFRGVNDDVESVGSDLAVQDVVDAIDFATSQEGVDAERVFTVGYSGGGMMSLLIAGRHPEKVTGVAAWGPPYDLIAFYEQSLRAGRHYASDIRAGCGGDPREAGPVQDECLRRSAMSHLDAAKDNGVAVYIAQGLSDPLVSPGQGVQAFNQLADPADRLSESQLEDIARGTLPEAISGELSTDSFFGEDDPAPLFARKSGSAWLVLFRADHEMVYGATLRWLAENAS